MATYKEIRGTQIEAVATDPSNPVEGQVWYNTTDNVLKGQIVTGAGTWATGGTMNTARYSTAGAGTQTAALVFGGEPVPSKAQTESYNGTNWTEVNDLNTGRQTLGGTGDAQTSILAAAGYEGSSYYTQAESWNGTNWTEVNDLSLGRSAVGMSGASNTSALVFGGGLPGAPPTPNTELWNGSNWTEVNKLNTSRRDLVEG